MWIKNKFPTEVGWYWCWGQVALGQEEPDGLGLIQITDPLKPDENMICVNGSVYHLFAEDLFKPFWIMKAETPLPPQPGE